MTDLFSQMAADVATAPTEEALTRIAQLAQVQQSAEQEVENLEDALKAAKIRLRQVQEKDLPDAILECGVTEFKLLNGAKITVKKFYQGKIAPEYADDAFSWLKDHGHDDIIKNEVALSFGKGEDEDAVEVMQLLKDAGYSPSNKKGVHPMTLKAFIKEMIEAGEPLPLETFGVYIGNKATIK